VPIVVFPLPAIFGCEGTCEGTPSLRYLKAKGDARVIISVI